MIDRDQDEIVPVPLHVLLVANDPDEYAYLRELLLQECEGHILLDHARTPEAALKQVEQEAYDLLLCDYQSGDGQAVELVRGARERGHRIPLVFLSDHIDESAMRSAVQAATCGAAPAAQLHEPSLTRAIRCGIEMYCKERQRYKAEDMLRKLFRAVEQAAEMIVITNADGAIENVNPAFETTTGYSRHEAV